ncbi:MAG: UxaA family hydrolase [Colwellia sp.]|nr:UxaA family hydrolase [Colwellia sp.]
MTDIKFVLLNEADNILVCCQAANYGEWVKLPNIELRLGSNIDIGHKVACNNIAKGQNVIRYGVSIGSATVDIIKGSHVHLHNMKSDYIPSHTRQSTVGE